MSWRDRPYSGEPDSAGELRLSFPKPTRLVTWLVIINVVVHFMHLASSNFAGDGFARTFGLSLQGLSSFMFWQPLTYMFVHSLTSIFHLVFNMIMLFFIGQEVERFLGQKRFLQFYITCGLVGGAAYLALGWIDPGFSTKPIVGASGAVYGLLIAAMIFFPQMQIIFIVFPMPIRVFGLILVVILVFQAISPGGIQNLGGEVCHIGGALAGVGIFYYWGMMPRIRIGGRGGLTIPGGSDVANFGSKIRKGAWERKQRRAAEEQAEVDRILRKVHSEGLAKLSRREKRLLSQATKRQKEQDRQAGRIDRL